MLSPIFFVPVACWLLAARDMRLRIRLGMLLFAIACLQVAVVVGWALADEPVTATAGLAMVAVVVSLCGWIFDAPGRSVRSTIGVTLSMVWSVLTTLVVLAVAALSGVGLLGVDYPKDDVLGSLSPGLVVLSTRTSVCWGSTQTYCYRRFVIGGSASIRDADVLTHVLDHLRGQGWSLDYDEGFQWWKGCRSTGWWLDRLHTCVWAMGPWTGAQQANRVITRGAGPEPPAIIDFANRERA
ncbi:hypothetical protein [Nocardia seriolae]|uniref:Uncharacterized protein n=1 Tax=Nocardia seriolae TaxID=37332 RepID=A0A0B8MZT3_9NOCA|nr:hypothetical protein [Nocardia seriolae]APA99389.1 hypothetical protein NS506_05343 [Nocardia seriolae]MTJ63223.1 hypothetical protein [Nocardia seriolae]MTJ72161.1 hypothetical protein [Nocardia seriolae]MTJ88974.1 hypothetical protein [Nocardia seriolae]MTK32954.1 hypothetical protein [Nocardia seriolae]